LSPSGYTIALIQSNEFTLERKAMKGGSAGRTP
jgi:hypothetical protein